MATFLRDLKHGARLVTKNPGFTIAAVLSLALGIGANTTIFTLINAVLLHPLPVDEPAELVSVWTTDERNNQGGQLGFLQLSPMNYRDLRDQNESFSGLAAHIGIPLNITGGTGNPEQVFGEIVTGNYFTVLGARPRWAASFCPMRIGTRARSWCACWVRRVAETLRRRPLHRRPHGVVERTAVHRGRHHAEGVQGHERDRRSGVVGAVHDVPADGERVLPGVDPSGFPPRTGFNVTGRLKPGVTVQQAEANLKTIARQLEQEYPNENKGRSVTLVPLAQATVNPGFRSNLVAAGGLLMTIVGLVLLIACANVANLLLARASSRQREIALRLSLGASRGQLIRQLLTEGAMLAMLGGVAGLLLAYWAQSALWSFRPPFLQPDAIDINPDMRVLLFTLGIALVTGLLFGLAPALQASRPNLVTELKENPSAPAGSRRLFSLRNILVASQVALSLVA